MVDIGTHQERKAMKKRPLDIHIKEFLSIANYNYSRKKAMSYAIKYTLSRRLPIAAPTAGQVCTAEGDFAGLTN